jgi:vancomycin resistance protein YoaR
MAKKRIIGIFIIPFVIFYGVYWGKIYPGVVVAGIPLGGKSPQEATDILGSRVQKPEKLTLEIETETKQSFEIPTDSFGLSYDLTKTSQRAYGLGRTGNPLFDANQILQALLHKKNYGLILKLDASQLQANLATIAGQVSVAPVYPAVKLEDDQIVIEKGKVGQELSSADLRLAISAHLANASAQPSVVQVKTIDPALTSEQETKLLQRAEKLKGKKIVLQFEFQVFSFQANTLFAFLDPYNSFKQDELEKVSAEIAQKIERTSQNPTFVFESGRVQQFAPAKEGIKLQRQTLAENLKTGLNSLLESEEKEVVLQVPVAKTAPEVNTENVNSLGIKELVGRGVSRFKGSIASRAYNINLAATRLNGTLIAPGETFSFNSALGDVSKLTGYKEAYIIQDGKTVLGDGGGVCQVSTTLFRAALNAGLPIVERRAHSYRVGYYEQDTKAGLDATVYSPTTDFKFQNNTSAHLLIQAFPDVKSSTLVFELYGSKDARQVTLTTPIVTDPVPPPEPLYIDDPNLPAGTVKQIDWAAWGAKSRFSYKVEKDGQIIFEKIFYSNYRPWQAKYLRGIGPTQ